MAALTHSGMHCSVQADTVRGCDIIPLVIPS